jgi:hypothetical protein
VQLLPVTPARNPSPNRRLALHELTSIVSDLPCLLVMVCILAKGSGDCDHPHTMTIRLTGFS